MKTQLSLMAVLLVAGFATNTAFAQTTAKEGLNRLKSNLDNSKSNLDDYKKNLKIVEANVSESTKARVQVEDQKNQASKALEENNQKLQSFEKNEAEINQLIQAEQKEIQAEDMKIAELNKVIAQLKDNQAKRNQNIASYQAQLKQVGQEKGEWKNRGDQISKIVQSLDGKAKSFAAQEADWKTKQKGYAGEVNRWQKEVDRQQKLTDNYNSLAEVKD